MDLHLRENDTIEKFKTGISNNKKHSRIQVIYNESNESIIKNFLKME